MMWKKTSIVVLLQVVSSSVVVVVATAADGLVEKTQGSDQQQATSQLFYHQHRQLPGWFEDFKLDGVTDSFNKLFATPVDQWDGSQWLLAAVLVLLTLWCCGCLACRRRGYYGGGGYRGYGNGYGYGGGGYPGYYGGGPSYGQYPGGGRRSGGGGFSGLCGNLLMCACCYELCCRDCQDVPFINGSAKVGNGGDGGDGCEYHRDAGIQIV